jgi:hypothetical protein
MEGEYDMFPDSSWKLTGDYIDKIFGLNLKEAAGGGFCVMKAGALPGDGIVIAVHITNDISDGLGSVFPMELISIIAALRLAKEVPGLHKLFSDSDAALKLLAKPAGLPYWSRKENLVLLQAVNLCKDRTLEHVRSHVETRKTSRDTWLPKEWGNWIADKVATGIESSLADFNVRWVNIKCSLILKDICKNGVWHLTNLNGDITLSSPEQAAKKFTTMNTSTFAI